MKFFRNAVYVLFSLSLLNLAGSFYMYRHIMNKSDVVQIRIPASKDLEELPLHAKLRDTQILQDLQTVEKVTYNNGKTIEEEAHN